MTEVIPARQLFTSDSVTEAHPGKICDQNSDAIRGHCLVSQAARVAREAATESDGDRHWVAVFGETTLHPSIAEVGGIVGRVLGDIGYTDVAFGTSDSEIQVGVLLSGQSAHISEGVDRAFEASHGDLADDLDTGAGDLSRAADLLEAVATGG